MMSMGPSESQNGNVSLSRKLLLTSEYRARILVQDTIYRRLRIGRDVLLNPFSFAHGHTPAQY